MLQIGGAGKRFRSEKQGRGADRACADREGSRYELQTRSQVGGVSRRGR